MLIDRFGPMAHVFRKYQRIMYWMPKFKNANPYPVPFDVPEDPLELAKLALRRMAVDLENKLSIFQVITLIIRGRCRSRLYIKLRIQEYCSITSLIDLNGFE